MNQLAARKNLIVAKADLHRQLFSLEHHRLQQRLNVSQLMAGNSRWWLVGGAVVAAVVFRPKWRTLAGWLPTLVTAWRTFGR